MKYLFFAITIVLQFLSLLSLKLLDNFYFIVAIFVLCIFFGAMLNFSKSETNSLKSNIGFGLFYGSLTSLMVVIVLVQQDLVWKNI